MAGRPITAAGWPADLDAIAATRGVAPPPPPAPSPPAPPCRGLCKGWGTHRDGGDVRLKVCPDCRGSGRADVRGDGVL